MGSTRTAPSRVKTSPSDDDEIIELRPPAELGFGGTAKFYKRQHAETIALLQARGYTVVNTPDDAA